MSLHMRLGLLLITVLLGTPVTASAQEVATRTDQRTFGTASTVSHTLGFSAFGAIGSSAAALADFNGQYVYCTSDCTLTAPVLLPAGAVVTIMELASCDATATGQVTVFLIKLSDPDGSDILLAAGNTGNSATPDCHLLAIPLNVAETIDNASHQYILRVFISGGDSDTRFRAVRIGYHLQVSPAPATATFNDVPTNHPFFPFVEALVAAGITTGCNASPPMYCPDNFVTRAQMAKFFSNALGLHFAP